MKRRWRLHFEILRDTLDVESKPVQAAIAASVASGIHGLADLDPSVTNFACAQDLLMWDSATGPDSPQALLDLEMRVRGSA